MEKMKRAVIVDAKRTVIGKENGVFKNFQVEELTSPVIKALSLNLQEPINDIILGNTVGPGGNIARLSALQSGLPYTIPGMTVDRQCGSGLEAIRIACHLIEAGAGDIYIAGGAESVSTSQYPRRARFSPESIGDPDMGIAAENIAHKYGITREEQDAFARLSYERTFDSYQQGFFADELIKIDGVPMKDEEIRDPKKMGRMLNRMPAVFKKDGTVTAGNSCGINDGASLVLVMSEEKANSLGYKPTLRFVSSHVSGVDPNFPATGPIPAVMEVLSKNDLTIHDIDLIQINEAFAVKVVLFAQEFAISYDKINREGGAISLGHPYGASGAILVTRLFNEAKRHNARLLLSTIGIGGGLGIAMLWENML